jgi:transposase InsO family protein
VGELCKLGIEVAKIEEVQIAPRSPWQNPYVERLIGSLRRELLDQVIVLNERHLRRLLTSYVSYYHAWRIHRALDMDAPETRPVQLPACGPLYRRCQRWAACITITNGGG